MFRVRGKVHFLRTMEDDDLVVLIEITDEEKKRIEESGEINLKIDNPIKAGNGDNAGKIFFKAHSRYEVDIYENGKLSDDIYASDLGRGSEIKLAVTLKENKYKGKPYQVAYLRGINVYSVEVPSIENPFEDDEE